jgi:hypothetical protein
MNSSNFENLSGQFLDVTVSLNGKVKTRNLKVCRVKARSLLFINVDKVNRLNTFFKVKYSDIEDYFNAIGLLVLKDGKIPDKWESSWDSIGGMSNSVQSYGRFANAARPSLTNYSSYMKPSTTNSVAGFPIV